MASLPSARGATQLDLGALVSENLHALFRAMMALPESEIDEGAVVARHIAFPHNPMFKGVWRTRSSTADIDGVIDETIAWFRKRDAPFFFWWTGPRTSPADLGDRLVKRGLLSMEDQQRSFAPGIHQTAGGAPAMAMDLADAHPSILTRVPSGFTIEEVADSGALNDFKRVFVESYEIPEWAGQAWVDATVAIGIGRTPWRMFLGRLDGEPVATNMLFNGGGAASVYAVATMPAARGMGIGGAITLKPLLAAREMGYRYAVLFSTEMGVSVYERIGFRDTGARIDRYLWRNS